MRTFIVIGGLLAGVMGSSVWLSAQVGPGDSDKGAAIYKAHCVRCHGIQGDGHGPDAKDLIVSPQDFHALDARDRSDFELLIAISNGVLFSPMHSWRGRLTDQEMMDVIRYIRELAPSRPMS